MVRSRILKGDGAEMEYWNALITEKSWNVLQKISKEIDFVLIGGWAIYLWAKSHKSKDIDIVIGYKELGKLKLNYNVKKNDNLKKYEIQVDEIDIDIYVPFYSKLPLIGKLGEHTTNIEGFEVVKPEFLLILKQAAELSRSSTEKGLKDRIDIMDLLLNCDVDFAEYNNLVEHGRLSSYRERLLKIVTEFKDIKYLDLNPRQFKLKKEGILKQIRR